MAEDVGQGKGKPRGLSVIMFVILFLGLQADLALEAACSVWHLDAHVCKESFSTLLDHLKRVSAVARIPEFKVSLKIVSIFL